MWVYARVVRGATSLLVRGSTAPASVSCLRPCYTRPTWVVTLRDTFRLPQRGVGGEQETPALPRGGSQQRSITS